MNLLSNFCHQWLICILALHSPNEPWRDQVVQWQEAAGRYHTVAQCVLHRYDDEAMLYEESDLKQQVIRNVVLADIGTPRQPVYEPWAAIVESVDKIAPGIFIGLIQPPGRVPCLVGLASGNSCSIDGGKVQRDFPVLFVDVDAYVLGRRDVAGYSPSGIAITTALPLALQRPRVDARDSSHITIAYKAGADEGEIGIWVKADYSLKCVLLRGRNVEVQTFDFEVPGPLPPGIERQPSEYNRLKHRMEGGGR